MSRRAGMLVGFLVAALGVLGVAWLLSENAERGGPASVLVSRAAETPTAPSPVAIASPGGGDVQALPPAADDTAQAEAPPIRGAELHCRVVADRDGAPLADVLITVFHHAVPYEPGPGSSRARTDRDGVARFAFPMASRAWLVRALPGPGHALCELRPKIVIEPGHVETLELRATHGATISGRIVDERKDPVPHALVSVWCDVRVNIENGDGPLPEPDLTVQADGAGHFLAEAVGPGFVMAASAPGMASVRVYQGVLNEHEVRNDAVLTLGPAHEIRGRVLSPARLPLAGLWVLARSGPPDGGHGVATTGRPLKVAARTDADGRFALAPLASRKWTLSVKHEQYGQWSDDRKPDDSEIEIVFTEGCRVAGVVRGADGAPLSGATLNLQGASEDVGYGPSGWATETSGEDGRFVFKGLMPTEEALLAVSAPGHAVQVLDHFIVGAGARDDLELRLVSELALAGQVVDELGQPLPGAGLTIRGDRIADVRWSPKPSWERLVGKSDAVSGADGRFRLDGLYDGEFRLTAKDPRHDGLSTTLTVRAGVEDLLVRLDPDALRGAIVGGTVSDGLTGAPLSKFSVSFLPVDEALRPADGYSSGANFDDPTGAYHMQGLTPGEYRISAHATGYVPSLAGPWTLEAGEHTIDLVLLPERTLHLRAVDQEGAPVANAFLGFEDTRGERIQLMQSPVGEGTIGATDKNGEVAAQGLPAAQVVAVLKVMRIPGFFAQMVDHRYTFDLREEPVGVQQVVVPRDKQRLLALFLYQQHGVHAVPAAAGAQALPGATQQAADTASALTGLDPTDRSVLERVTSHHRDGSLGELTIAASVTLRGPDGTVLDSASCVPVGKDRFALSSIAFSGESPTATLLLLLPHDATTVDVSAAGCAPEHLKLPAGDANANRMVVLRPAD